MEAASGSTAPHAGNDELNNQEGLHRILDDLHLPEAIEQALHANGIACIADFAYAYYTTADLDSFAESMSEVFWASQGVTDPLHSRPMARLRRALVQAQVRVKQYEAEAVRTPEPSTASASAPPAGPAPSAEAWVEHAPQRLDNDTVARMVTEFKEAYPGELLDSNAMPSIRLLSLVHAWFKDAATPRIKYVPRQYRMSQRQYTEIVEARAHRVIRTEAQLLSTALFDDTPTIGLESHIINASWLGARQRIFSNAIALCKGAHLAVLKAFDAKVLELCTQTWQPGHGLRNVTAEELLDADRKLWHSIAGLVEDQKFTLDEALHEFTNVRGDVHSLLQPRARTYAPPPAPHAPGGPRPPRKGLGKGRGGKTGSPNRPQRTAHAGHAKSAAYAW